MKKIKKISVFFHKKYIELYHKSKMFRNFSNSLGMGFSSVFLYGMSGGACPCCGKNPSTCAIGIGGISLFGAIIGILAFIFLTIRDGYIKIKRKLGWKEKKL